MLFRSSYDITQKSGSPLAVGGFSTYNYTKTDGKNTYIYLDDIAFKKINRAPEVASYISGQKVVAGSELVVDLSNVFTDADGDSLTLTAEHGAVNGTVYTITPSSEGTITEPLLQMMNGYLRFGMENNRACFDIFYRKQGDRKSTRLNSSHKTESRMPSSA